MSVQSWLQTHKTQAGLGAAGVVGLYAPYRRSQTASSTGAPASSLLGGTTSPTAAPTVGYDSSNLDQYNQLAGAISNQNDQIDTLQAQLSQMAAGNTTPGPSGNGTWLANPLGNQPGGRNEQAAFLGTENYGGDEYNVYNLSTLEAASGPTNWLSTLYPGQNPGQVWASGNVSISPTGTEVAVPVFSGYGPLSPSGFLPKGSVTP